MSENRADLSPVIANTVAQAIAGAYSLNTRRAYRGHMARFETWAVAQGVAYLPANESTLAAWLLYLWDSGRSISTIRQARAAVVFAHRASGYDSPARQELKAVIKSIARRVRRPAVAVRKQPQAPGLTAQGLAAIRATAHIPRRGRGGKRETEEFACRRGAVDVALAAVMRDGLLRIGETQALTWDDISPSPDESGAALIRRSKTDPEGHGEHVYLGRAAMGALDAIRPLVSHSTDSVFGMSVSQLGRRLKAMCAAAGLGDKFSGHSPRVGMAQDLAESGATVVDLMNAGRWKRAEMVKRYTERQAIRRGAVAKYYGI